MALSCRSVRWRFSCSRHRSFYLGPWLPPFLASAVCPVRRGNLKAGQLMIYTITHCEPQVATTGLILAVMIATGGGFGPSARPDGYKGKVGTHSYLPSARFVGATVEAGAPFSKALRTLDPGFSACGACSLDSSCACQEAMHRSSSLRTISSLVETLPKVGVLHTHFHIQILAQMSDTMREIIAWEYTSSVFGRVSGTGNSRASTVGFHVRT